MGSFARIARHVVMLVAAAAATGVAWAQSPADGFNPGADPRVSSVAVQADGRILAGGTFTMLGGGGPGTIPRSYIGRLNADGSVDAFNPGANGQVRAIAVQPDGKILVGGDFTTIGGGGTGSTPRSRIARLQSDGSVDLSFDPGADSSVRDFAIQPDGKIVIGGTFTTLGGGGTGRTLRRYIGRLHADGAVDTTFSPTPSGSVNAVALQRDGGVVFAGVFTGVRTGAGSTTRRRIARVFSNGSLDPAFDPDVSDGSVHALAIQPDGRIIVGGNYAQIGGVWRGFLARVHTTGSVDASFSPEAMGPVVDLALQPDGRIIVAGAFSVLAGSTRNRVGRLNADGSLDPSFNPDADGQVDDIALQPDGRVVLAGLFNTLGGTARNRIGRLLPDGSVEKDFVADVHHGVWAVALQPDGKLLIAGDFTTVAGLARPKLARLTASGAVDAFNPGASRGVHALAVQPDGKILVGGTFTALGNGGTSPRSYVGRVNPDGTLDSSFDPGANGWVEALVVEPEGTILAGGRFTTIGGGGTGTASRVGIARLHADGSVDTSFNPPQSNGKISVLARQADGKILVGGDFTSMDFTERRHLARLNADGSLDTTFDPGTDSFVHSIVVQPDGKIVVGGSFTTIGGGGSGAAARNRIARLNPDGALDLGFTAGANGMVRLMALQADGRILLAGEFTTLGEGTDVRPRLRIGRVHADGSVDTEFDPGVNASVGALVLQADGKIVVGGFFGGIGGGTGDTVRWGLARLTNTSPAHGRLSVNAIGSTVTWQRSGSGPEVARTTFEVSIDGLTYSFLGHGMRVASGWQLGGLNLRPDSNLFVRARGFTGSGASMGSSAIVESVAHVYLSYTPFSEPLGAGQFLRAVHVTELRTRIDAMRGGNGLSPFPWTDPSLAAGMTARAVHLEELRFAVREAYTAAGHPPPAFTDSAIAPGVTVIQASTSWSCVRPSSPSKPTDSTTRFAPAWRRAPARRGLPRPHAPASGRRVRGSTARPACGPARIRKRQLLMRRGISITIIHMRTTLDLPESLVDEARSALGYTSKTDTVVFALREVVRRSRLDELKTLMGKVEFDFDPRALRKKERRRR